MTTILRHTAFIILTVLLFNKINAQDTTTTNFFEQIKAYDLSTVLSADSILTEDREDGKEKIKRAEILGFIGDDYQRFFIHFVSVSRNPTNPYEYLVSGQTKVKESICSFQGTITIRQASIYKSGDIPTYRQGFATCEVILNEDKKQSSTGFIKGNLKSEFLIDNKGRFRYDAIMFVGDGFSNNQFIGNWTSYKTNSSKNRVNQSLICFSENFPTIMSRSPSCLAGAALSLVKNLSKSLGSSRRITLMSWAKFFT